MQFPAPIPRSQPIAIDIFHYWHVAHNYRGPPPIPDPLPQIQLEIPRRASPPWAITAPLKMRNRQFLIFKTYDGPPRITCTFVHNGIFGEFDQQWFSSEEHGSGAGILCTDGKLHPTEATFSFIGNRGWQHSLIIDRLHRRSREYFAWHLGRPRSHRRPGIAHMTPWAQLSRVDASSLGSQRKYDNLVRWLLSRPRMPNTRIMDLGEIMSRI